MESISLKKRGRHFQQFSFKKPDEEGTVRLSGTSKDG